MFKEYKSLNLPEVDKEILEFWKANDVFQRSISERSADDSFVFYEGPPSANGMPGIHHVMARTIKDIFCRFQTLQGKRVERKGGWDTHGLPIELKVESELGITKEDIGTKISVDDYNKACKETVMRYKGIWDDITQKMGYWVDLENPYVTYEKEYMETVWWLLKQIYDKGLMYKGYTVQPYSPAAGTGLSSHELNMPGAYQEVSDTTVVAMFNSVKDANSSWLFSLPVAPATSQKKEAEVSAVAGAMTMGSEDSSAVHIIAWTTTPWTLPSNTALTVGPNIEYVKVRTKNQYTNEPNDVVLAKELVGNWFGGHNQPTIEAISEPFSGEKLVGIRYEQVLKGPTPEDGDAFRIIPGNFVTTDAGTGIVHTAPSFGQDDMAVGKANGIGSLTLVDKQGKFTDDAGQFAGRYVKDYKNDPEYKDVNVDIAIHLKTVGLAFNVNKYNHSYPHCWRTDKPVLYYPLDSWFIKASAVKERMSELNETINWQPESTGSGRFGKWLENLNDWNLSRSRYWGTPLPIWRSECGTEEVCIGSIAELQAGIDLANKELGLSQEVPQDLHRPYIDEVVLFQNGKKLVRELDLIDVWFDSGAMPYAQWHYPFENEDKFDRAFPADFIAEGVDQTRGWFYTLHAIGTMVFDSVAYKNVVSNGLVLDKDGKKMSKRLGNAADPFDTIDTYGADATRWYMISNANPWDNLKFNEDGIQEVRRTFFGTLYNTYGFFALYANVDNYDPNTDKSVAKKDLAEIDRWIISRLNSLTKQVTNFYATYDATPACRAIEQFVNAELSNWYVRQCRRRFWKGEMSSDKRAAYQTLHQCLVRVTQLMSPVAPFYAEQLYRDLTGAGAVVGAGEIKKEQGKSVHLSLLPEADEKLIDTDLEVRMDYAQRLSSLTLSLRKADNLRVRQPLQKILVPATDEEVQRRITSVAEIIKNETNVKEVELLTDGDFLRKSIKPNFRVLGKKVGKKMKDVAARINQMGTDEIAMLERAGGYVLTVGAEEIGITLEDVTIATEDIPGWKVATDGELTVALDVTITPELAKEGLARELVNRIQNLRKEQGYEVTDRIRVRLQGSAGVEEAATAYREYISDEVLADSLVLDGDVAGEVLELPGEETVTLVVAKV
ncbi:isoleucine--tRNA ligase [Neolewinella antarctica]|uniref:Isoleucine--tRNA ligase n=1 Tax=Neolewinella antarctica TaxID=442734 RepID=A0ABX0XEH7_9BACT|nr:isoleucine--tRNA ligase [Neolewinella antarctica]NJC27306.1 isoleucyl-tRNA synthetase [Neolewinella antarctica]